MLFDAASTSGDGDKFMIVSVSFLHRLRVAELSWLHVSLGVGLARYSFQVERKYGDRISPVRSGGVYDYLGKIESSGGSTGFLLQCGIELGEGKWPSLLVGASYLLVPEIHTDINTGESVAVRLSNVVLGAKGFVYF